MGSDLQIYINSPRPMTISGDSCLCIAEGGFILRPLSVAMVPDNRPLTGVDRPWLFRRLSLSNDSLASTE